MNEIYVVLYITDAYWGEDMSSSIKIATSASPSSPSSTGVRGIDTNPTVRSSSPYDDDDDDDDYDREKDENENENKNENDTEIAPSRSS